MRKFVVIILGLLLVSCNSNKSNEQANATFALEQDTSFYACDDDYQIINSTFVYLEGGFWPEEVKKNFGYNNFTLTTEEKKKYRETVDFKDVYFTQYLVGLGKDSVNINTYRTSVSEIEIDDKGYMVLAKALINSDRHNIKLDSSKINNISFTNLIPVNYANGYDRNTFSSNLTYSIIEYNQDKTKACFYIESQALVSCYGAFILMEKVNEIWQIKEEILDWVE